MREVIPARVDRDVKDAVRHRGYTDVQRYPLSDDEGNDIVDEENIGCTTTISQGGNKIEHRVFAKMRGRSSITMYYDHTISTRDGQVRAVGSSAGEAGEATSSASGRADRAVGSSAGEISEAAPVRAGR